MNTPNEAMRCYKHKIKQITITLHTLDVYELTPFYLWMYTHP